MPNATPIRPERGDRGGDAACVPPRSLASLVVKDAVVVSIIVFAGCVVVENLVQIERAREGGSLGFVQITSTLSL